MSAFGMNQCEFCGAVYEDREPHECRVEDVKKALSEVRERLRWVAYAADTLDKVVDGVCIHGISQKSDILAKRVVKAKRLVQRALTL